MYPKRLALEGDTLYGTTESGGALGNPFGNVFKVNTDGTGYAVLKMFDGTNYALPFGGVIVSNHVLFGTTRYAPGSGGTVYRMNTDGTGFAVLHTFPSSSTNNFEGAEPVAEVLLDGGVLYGTTSVSGSGNSGTIFQVGTDGNNFAVLHSFLPGHGGRMAA